MKTLHPFLFVTVFITLLAGCSNEPGEHVEDPRAYLMDKLLTMEHNAWWNPYRVVDEAFIGALLDERMEKEITWDDGVPHDTTRLDRFFLKTKGRLTSAHTATSEMRERVMENIRKRYANPQIKLARKKEGQPGIAIVDFGHIPGEWITGRGGWHFRSLGTNGFDLAQEDVTRGFQLAHATFPDAYRYLIRGTLFYGSSAHKSEYQYEPYGERLYYVHNLSRYYSRDTYPLEKVLSGEIVPSEVEMDGVMQDSIHSPLIINMRPLEDPHGYLMEYYQE